ncbi:MAG: PKD domain-containing protein [Saprospiraceae bacterium]|nr:PKD domain-containing protein [Saprospiraceae bacterium]
MSLSNVSTCDSTGGILLVSNSCNIENQFGNVIENSDSLNPGLVYDQFCTGDEPIGYRSTTNMLLLQQPDSTHLYYLFHRSVYFTITPLVAYGDKLRYSVVDVAKNNGEGLVLEKNTIILEDTLSYDGICAVRHGNGRDWWILTTREKSNNYFTFLFTPEGLTMFEQTIGVPTWSEAGGEILFSPDGSKLARFNPRDDLRVFDFDRCTGLLSNPVHVPVIDDADEDLTGSAAFSADGRFLYCAEVERLLQFDMFASDLAESKKIIAERKSNPECPNGSSIAYLELAPDGRIYATSAGGNFCMHRIGRPELVDTLCNYIHHYFILDYPFVNPPHFPNFRLGPIDGSACDTLGINNLPLANWRYDRAGGLSVDFTSVSWYEPTAWSWEFGDPTTGANNYSSEKHPSHTFSAPGGYDVCLTVSNAYGSDTKCKTVWVNTVGTDAPEQGSALKVYPNPTTGDLQWEGAENAATVRVYNLLGQLQLEQFATSQQVDLSRLPVGLYSVQFYAEDGALVGVRKVTRVD